mgnify:CR=1 FL=1|tara:strand:- start:3764 stop:6583 length:2820 start_codon:yes stop_codon:yes gene_type:complete
MAIIQNKYYKDHLLIVDTPQVGPKDRGNYPITDNNSIINGISIDFHPMVRDNWGTVDPLRGALAAYQAVYTSTAGPALANYAGIVEDLRQGENPGASEMGVPDAIGRLSRQLKPTRRYTGATTNVIFNVDYPAVEVTTPGKENELLINLNNAAWNSYQAVDGPNANSSTWLNNSDNFEDYLKGTLAVYNLLPFPSPSGNPTFQGILYGGLLNSQALSRIYLDHTSLHYLMPADKGIRAIAGLATDIEPVYNFYVTAAPDYEEVIADPKVKEYLIPNAYYLEMELRNTGSSFLAPHHGPAITMGGIVKNWYEVVGTAQTATEKNVDSYYKVYSDSMASAIAPIALAAVTSPFGGATDTLATVEASNKDLAVLNSDVEILKEGFLDSEVLPFYNKITIAPDADSNVDGPNSQLFLDSIKNDPDTAQFLDLLQGYAVHQYYNTIYTALPFTTREKVVTNEQGEFNFSSQEIIYKGLFDLQNVITNRILETVPWPNFINNYGQRYKIELPVKFLKDYSGDVNQDASVATEAAENARLDYYPDDRPNELMNAYKRTLEQVFLNQTCHSETLLYIVEKYRVPKSFLGMSIAPSGEESQEELVQTFFFTPTDFANLNYYDTQIKYDQTYRYEFKKVALVFGNKYSYERVTDDSPPYFSTSTGPRKRAKIDYLNELSVQAVVLPYTYGGIEAVVRDKPPVSPGISFYPLKGNDNQVIMLLSPNTGEYSDRPTAILQKDKAYISSEYYSQTGKFIPYNDIRSNSAKIEYRSDDPVDRYELFKINFEPESYEDFAQGSLIPIDPDSGLTGYYKDSIVPNRKYYYCARSIDVHANISNPTYIFEIELVNNNGQIFLRQKVLDFKQEKQTYTKSGRRFIYVDPVFQQTALSQANFPEDPQSIDFPPPDNILGIVDKKVWTKNFKLRITSKKTGKKMDLNLTFKNSGVTNPS